ncbi:uncharacterized protein ACR2FA_009173 [Aphomia sociella]
MTLSRDRGQLGIFRCRKSNCRTKDVSRALGTLFENVRLPLSLLFELMYMFCYGKSYDEVQREVHSPDRDTIVSHKTIADWYSYCREVVVVYELEHKEEREKIGGPGKIVQIDKTKFGKRKYNRRIQVEGHWVIGMVEDGSDDLRMEVCPDNEGSAKILVPLIKKHVQEGSIIYTDFWSAYDCLLEHGYVHIKINYTDPEHRFVAPDGTSTQSNESYWHIMEKIYQKQNYKDFTMQLDK